MSWWQLAVFVCSSIAVVAFTVAGGLCALWRRQERKDGLR